MRASHTPGEKMKETRICHFTIIDGNEKEIENLAKALSLFKETTEMNIEFLVTNDRIQLTTTKQLLKEIAALYKKENMIKKGK